MKKDMGGGGRVEQQASLYSHNLSSLEVLRLAQKSGNFKKYKSLCLLSKRGCDG